MNEDFPKNEVEFDRSFFSRSLVSITFLNSGGQRAFAALAVAIQNTGMRHENATMLKLRQHVPQDEMNLILGGNAAKLFKLPVPHERMFLCGKPDIFGIHWEESIPYIPREQVQFPDFPVED